METELKMAVLMFIMIRVLSRNENIYARDVSYEHHCGISLFTYYFVNPIKKR